MVAVAAGCCLMVAGFFLLIAREPEKKISLVMMKLGVTVFVA